MTQHIWDADNEIHPAALRPSQTTINPPTTPVALPQMCRMADRQRVRTQ